MLRLLRTMRERRKAPTDGYIPGVFHLFIVADFGGSASFLEFFDEAVDVPVVREVDHDATAAVFRAFDADLL